MLLELVDLLAQQCPQGLRIFPTPLKCHPQLDNSWRQNVSASHLDMTKNRENAFNEELETSPGNPSPIDHPSHLIGHN